MDTENGIPKTELEVLTGNSDLSTQILEGIITETEENTESLEELINEERKLREAIRAINDKIAAKRSRRAELANAERLAKREQQAAEVKLKQYNDAQSKESSKLENFQKMTDFAWAEKFAWTESAYTHQWQGALQLAHYGSGLLADTMGLGKTLQSVMYLDLINCGHAKLGAKKVLIICPDAMVTEYVDTITNWAPHRKNIIPLTGATATGRSFAKIAAENYDQYVIVSNFNAIYNKDMAWLQDHELDTIIIDEAHNINNTDGVTFESVRALKSKFYLPITATFILNKPQDLFASLNLVLPRIFQEEVQFLAAYCTLGYENKWTFKEGGEAALMRNLGGRIVKREYEEAGIVLPEPTRITTLIPMSELSTEQFEFYQQITKYSEIMLEETSAGIESMIALITRQRQALTFPAGITIRVTQSMYDKMTEMGVGCEPVGTVLLKVPDSVPSIKVDKATESIVKAVKNGHRTVVFSQFKTALEGLEKSLLNAGVKVVRFDGDTKKDLRVKIKQDFKRKPKGSPYEWEVVLCNYKTGGVGLTFTAATYLLEIDEEWNPGKKSQAEARVQRIGQTENVLIETMRIDDLRDDNGNAIMGSIDIWMKQLNDIKAAMIGGFDSELADVNFRDSYRNFLSIKPMEAKAVETKAVTAPKPVKKAIAELDLDDIFDL